VGYASNGLRVVAATILLVIGLAAGTAGARPLLQGTKRADRLSGKSAAETLRGGRGNDRLSGGGGNDLLLGGPGNDRLSGDAGRDDLRGEAGNDLLSARDGRADRIDCGPGRDRAVVDAIDAPVRGCEQIDVKRQTDPVQQASPPAGTPPKPPVYTPPSDPLFDASKDSELIAAGDIAGRDPNGIVAGCTAQAEQTAKLVDKLSGAVAVLGDAVYEVGSTDEYTDCYTPSWGRHKWRTRPVVGDHDYKTPGAAGFFAYFGAAGGELGKGWYSYDIGTWHAVVLNTACDQIGGCGLGSPQEGWLRADLAAHPSVCTLAYWHTPFFSSGSHGNTAAVGPLFEALYDYGVELVLSGNDHDYERFAPQSPAGDLDQAKGVRQFVVGTGGRYLRPLDATHQPNSEAANDTTFGVLDLKLNPAGYDWKFVPVPGSAFSDSGTAACH
jgi:hemolysin type calcium-binding protein